MKPVNPTAVRSAVALFVVGALAIALAVRADPPTRSARRDVYTIPPGTALRVEQGLSVADVLPPVISTEVGNELVVINHDVASHAFGPFVLAPGQQWARQFAVMGDYAMTCTIYPNAGFTVAVASGPDLRTGLTLRLQQVLQLAWLALTALIVGSHLAGAVTLGGTPGEAALGARLVATARAVGPTALALAVLAAAACGAALSRVVPWRSALTGTASLDAWFGAVWTIAAVLVARRHVRTDPLPSGWSLFMWALVIIWPASRALAPAVSPTAVLLLLAGAGLLAAVVIALRQVGGADATGLSAGGPNGGTTMLLAGLMACGLVLVVAGVPISGINVPARIALGVTDLALGLVLVGALPRWLARPVELRRLVYGVALVAGATGAMHLALAAVGGVMTPVVGG